MNANFDLLDKVEALEECDEHVSSCCMCAGPKSTFEVVCSDAATMYERIDPAGVLNALDTLLAFAAHQGLKGMVVCKTTKMKGWPTADSGYSGPGADWLPWRRLRTGLSLALCQRWVTFGDKVVNQKHGVPIGGPSVT